MQWLWVWLALGVGLLWLLSRARHGAMTGGCGLHRSAHGGPAATDSKALIADTERDEKAEQAAERSAARTLQDRGGCC